MLQVFDVEIWGKCEALPAQGQSSLARLTSTRNFLCQHQRLPTVHRQLSGLLLEIYILYEVCEVLAKNTSDDASPSISAE
jgi:hypothetical protein